MKEVSEKYRSRELDLFLSGAESALKRSTAFAGTCRFQLTFWSLARFGELMDKAKEILLRIDPEEGPDVYGELTSLGVEIVEEFLTKKCGCKFRFP